MNTRKTSVRPAAKPRWFGSRLGFWLALFACQGVCLAAQATARAADGPDQPEDRRLAEEHGWVYNDLATGFAEAKRTGKPLFIVIRCPP